jgi:hypothetical protein
MWILFINNAEETSSFLIYLTQLGNIILSHTPVSPIKHYRHCAYDIFRAYEEMKGRKIKTKKRKAETCNTK